MLIDITFFAVFLCQIILISLFYAKKMYDKSNYILSTFPASDYPKLYENSKFADPVKFLRDTFRNHYRLHIAIATLGFSILFIMLVTGYAPSQIKESGHLAFVMLFIVLQAIPYIRTSITEQKWQKNMRKSAPSITRNAVMQPRKLFDFISPIYIAIALFAYIGWMVYYFYNKGFTTPLDWQSYVTVFFMTALNLMMIGLGYRALRGKKIDPHQAYKDQLNYIGTIIRVFVFASIIMSVQLVVFDTINQQGWDMFEPIALSLYTQVIMIFGIGEVMRRYKVKDVDYSVYQNAPS